MEQSIAPRNGGAATPRGATGFESRLARGTCRQLRRHDTANARRLNGKLADLIICGSEFVCEGIRGCHGPVEKCVVVPYGVDLQLPNENGGNVESGRRLNRPESFYDPRSSYPRAEQNGQPLCVS